MANENTIKTFTALDIEKYYKGLLSPGEMHAMEKAALDDPFLADAMEGYTVPGVNAEADIEELKKRLEEKSSRNKIVPLIPERKSSLPWMRVAAMLVLIAGAGFLIYKFGFPDSDNGKIAKNDKPRPTQQKEVSTGTQPGANSSIDSVTYHNPQETTSEQTGNSSNLQLQKTEVPIATIENKQEQYEKDIQADDVKDLFDTIQNDDFFAKKAAPKTNPLTQNNWAKAPAKQNADISRDKLSQLGSSTQAPRLDSALKDFIPGLVANTDERKAKEAPVSVRGISSNTNSQGFASIPRHNVFRGRVTDANNNALPFANITNTYDNVGTYSDAKGNFTLISTDSVMNVQVRSVGFENSATVLVPGTRENQIVMQEDYRSLGEVVINSNSRATNLNRSRNNTIVHEEPEPVDGWVNYDIYVANNLKTPDTLLRSQSQRGYVELSFDVNKNGEPVNITIDKSLCDSCDKEAVRLLKEGPKWKQKSRRNKRTSVTISF